MPLLKVHEIEGSRTEDSIERTHFSNFPSEASELADAGIRLRFNDSMTAYAGGF
jgi:hypothetical protein